MVFLVVVVIIVEMNIFIVVAQNSGELIERVGRRAMGIRKEVFRKIRGSNEQKIAARNYNNKNRMKFMWIGFVYR